MSIEYTIKIKIEADYNQENISSILEKGSNIRFVYYYHKFGQSFENMQIINAQQAAQKIIQEQRENAEGGPNIFTIIDKGTVAKSDTRIWFFKDDNNFIEMYIGSFGDPKEKDHFIDFSYYIKMFLSLVDSFTILELHAYSEE